MPLFPARFLCRPSGPHRVIALDPATACGVAVGHYHGPVVTPVMRAVDMPVSVSTCLWDVTPTDTGDRAHSDRPVKLWTRLDSLVREGAPVAAIAFEQVAFHTSHYAALVHGELCGVIKLIAHQHGIPLTGFSPATLKKVAAGSGHATKEQVRDGVVRRFGLAHAPDTLDESDALACLLALLSGADSNGVKRGSKLKQQRPIKVLPGAPF